MTQGARRPRRGGTTIEEVARAAGVSRQTVSNVLNAPQRVRPETLAAVTRVIDELGYRPDQSARSLRTGARRTLGYLAPVDDPFDPNPLMSGFLEALVDAAGAEGQRILLFRPAQGSTDPRPVIDELIAGRQVDGLLLADVLHDDPRIAHLAGAGIPYAAFGRTGPAGPDGLTGPAGPDGFTGPDGPRRWVDIDNRAAMADIARHLADRGHRRVGYLGPAEGPPWLEARHQGFHTAAGQLGLSVVAGSTAAATATVAEDPARAVAAVRALLRTPDRPTALAASGDLTALTAYEAIRAEGLAVGRDVAVTGFHDTPVCRHLHPTLTSVRLPLRRIAGELVRALLAQIREDPLPGPGAVLPAELVVRGSSG
ncbi:LacI family DNA-binding transcriptional regulator [Kitasatospora sp. NPDC004240]